MKTVTFTTCLCIIPLVFCNCFMISTKYDLHSKFYLAQTSGNTISATGEATVPEALIAMNMEKLKKDEHSVYVLDIEYKGKNWIRIKQGESLIFHLNGDKIALTTIGPPFYYEFYNGEIMENACYQIDEDDFERIVSAETIEFELKGELFSEKRPFNRKNFKNINKFYYEYVAADKIW